jgi:hypothetical protein
MGSYLTCNDAHNNMVNGHLHAIPFNVLGAKQ